MTELHPAEYWNRKNNVYLFFSSPAWRYHPTDPKPWATPITEAEYWERVHHLREEHPEVYVKLGGPQITTYEGFHEWRSRQGRDANVGTALMTRRFKEAGIVQLNEWFNRYEIEWLAHHS